MKALSGMIVLLTAIFSVSTGYAGEFVATGSSDANGSLVLMESDWVMPETSPGFVEIPSLRFRLSDTSTMRSDRDAGQLPLRLGGGLPETIPHYSPWELGPLTADATDRE